MAESKRIFEEAVHNAARNRKPNCPIDSCVFEATVCFDLINRFSTHVSSSVAVKPCKEWTTVSPQSSRHNLVVCMIQMTETKRIIVGICALAHPWEAVIIGAVGAVCTFPAPPLLDYLKMDDPVGVVPVHLICGIWGMLATGIFVRNVIHFAFTPHINTL